MKTGLLAAAAALALNVAPVAAAGNLDKVSHILVIYLENRSFDHLFGDFTDAGGNRPEGVHSAAAQIKQLDHKGDTPDFLPEPDDPRIFKSYDNPANVRNLELPRISNDGPFAIDKVPEFNNLITIETVTHDLTHSFYANQAQINKGGPANKPRNNRFAEQSSLRAFTMGYYSADAMADTALWKLARENLLLDRFFQGAFGGSFLNHMWLVCACRPTLADGKFAVDTIQSALFHDQGETHLLPPQHATTIGDVLSKTGAQPIDWAWYSGGWTLANIPPMHRTPQQRAKLNMIKFQWHHQPFAYFDRFDPSSPAGKAERRKHLRDAADLDNDIMTGQLPPIAFYKPAGYQNGHSDYSNIYAADAEVRRVVELMNASPIKDNYAIIITFDEFGGFFDHVPPPDGDDFGPGTRIPAIVVSPLLTRRGIDSTPYDMTSIVKLIVKRFGLNPLPSTRFEGVNGLDQVFAGP
jgi:phospholipase C